MNSKVKYIVKKVISVLCLSICLCVCYQGEASRVEAAEDIIKCPEALKSLDGSGKYMDSDYTYRIDIEETGILDAGNSLMNTIENALLGLEIMFAKVAVMVFYYCMSFNASSILSGVLNDMQATLHTAIFEPALYIALAATAIKLLKRLLQKNFVGAIQDCGYVIAIMVLAALVVNNSGAMLTTATDLSKSIGLDAMVGLNNSLNGEGSDAGSSYVDNYAVNAAGMLWDNMAHKLWVQLEYKGEDEDTELTEKLLKESSVEKRKKAATESEKKCFAKERAGEGLGLLLMYLIPLIIKGSVYIVLAAVQIFFQVFAVFFVLLAPIILIVSVFPGYDTMIIEVWLKKIMEFELGIILSTMIIAFLVFLDNYMFSQDYGWLLCFMMQIVIALSMYFGRSQIFGIFSKLQRSVQSPGFAAGMLRNSANMNNVRHTAERMRSKSTRAVHTGSEYVGNVSGFARRRNEYQKRELAEDYKKYNLESAVKEKKIRESVANVKPERVEKKPERQRPITKAARREQEEKGSAQNVVAYRRKPNVYTYKNPNAEEKVESKVKTNTVRKEAEVTNERLNRQPSKVTHTSDDVVQTVRTQEVTKSVNTNGVNITSGKEAVSQVATSVPAKTIGDSDISQSKAQSKVPEKSLVAARNEPEILIRPQKNNTDNIDTQTKRNRTNTAAKSGEKRSVSSVTFSSPNIKIRERMNTHKARTGLNEKVAEKRAKSIRNTAGSKKRNTGSSAGSKEKVRAVSSK